LQRLKTRDQFQAVLAGGTVARTLHFALHCAALDAPPARPDDLPRRAATARPLFALRQVWLGAMVPKRWAKRAVTRNAIKREIYTVSNHFESALPVAAHVVRLRAGFDRAQFISASSGVLRAAVRQELQRLFAQATVQPTAHVRLEGTA